MPEETGWIFEAANQENSFMMVFVINSAQWASLVLDLFVGLCVRPGLGQIRTMNRSVINQVTIDSSSRLTRSLWKVQCKLW